MGDRSEQRGGDGRSGELLAFRRDPAAVARILRERGEALAQPATFAGDISDTSDQIICFRCGESSYGAELHQLREIRTVDSIAVVPCTPRFMLGLIQVHGDITPVVDLVEFFGFRRTEPLPRPMTVLVLDVERHSVGLAADELFDVRPLRKGKLLPVPATLNKTEREVTRGLTSDRTMVLAGDALVLHQRLRVGAG